MEGFEGFGGKKAPPIKVSRERAQNTRHCGNGACSGYVNVVVQRNGFGACRRDCLLSAPLCVVQMSGHTNDPRNIMNSMFASECLCPVLFLVVRGCCMEACVVDRLFEEA